MESLAVATLESLAIPTFIHVSVTLAMYLAVIANEWIARRNHGIAPSHSSSVLYMDISLIYLISHWYEHRAIYQYICIWYEHTCKCQWDITYISEISHIHDIWYISVRYISLIYISIYVYGMSTELLWDGAIPWLRVAIHSFAMTLRHSALVWDLDSAREWCGMRCRLRSWVLWFHWLSDWYSCYAIWWFDIRPESLNQEIQCQADGCRPRQGHWNTMPSWRVSTPTRTLRHSASWFSDSTYRTSHTSHRYSCTTGGCTAVSMRCIYEL